MTGRAGKRTVVSAADFSRNFGQLRHLAVDQPVFVTHHGREAHVLITADRYRDLEAGETPSIAGVPTGDIGALLEWLPQAVVITDAAGAVLLANRAAHALLAARTPLAGQALFDAVPAIAGSLIEAHLKRAIFRGETCSADVPSPVREGAWLRVEMRPSGDHVITFLADITDEMVRTRLANGEAAALRGARAHDGIGQIQLNARGHIVSADQAAVSLLGIAEARLAGVAMIDTIPRAGRAAFREALERVCSGSGAERMALEVVSNGNEVVRLDVTIVELRSAFGTEGAVITMVRANAAR